jgi:predicted DNA-binding transcriptional regulator AlpA
MRTIRRDELTDNVGYRLAQIYRLGRWDLFPQRFHLGHRTAGCVVSARVLDHG